MHDVNPAIADESGEGRPDSRVQGVPLANLHLIDRQLPRAIVDPEDRIAEIADVADRDREARPIRSLRAEQNRLFGSAAGAAVSFDVGSVGGAASAVVLVACATERHGSVASERTSR